MHFRGLGALAVVMLLSVTRSAAVLRLAAIRSKPQYQKSQGQSVMPGNCKSRKIPAGYYFVFPPGFLKAIEDKDSRESQTPTPYFW